MKAFRQEYGVDFEKVFSPVVKMTTLRFLLGVIAAENIELHQLDVKTRPSSTVILMRKSIWRSRKASRNSARNI